MADFVGSLVLIAVAVVATFIGAQAIRDIARGRAQALGRMSSRVYFRSEQPLHFWLTVGAEMIWLLLGLFLLYITLGGIAGLF